MNSKIKAYINVSLFWFAVIALIGTLLRLMFISNVNFLPFQNLLHSHSHVAMLGWLYSVLIISVIYSYVNYTSFKKYSYNFWITQVSVIGMLITFALQGYGTYSIAFSTLHIFVFYWFVLIFSKDITENQELKNQYSVSLKFIKASLLFFFLSTLAPFALAVITVKGFANSEYYKMLIYFYLHFQYNGWFTFVMTGLLVFILENKFISLNQKMLNISFWILFITAFPSYVFSLLSLNYGFVVSVLMFATALFQLYAVKILIGEFLKFRKVFLNKTNGSVILLFYFGIISLFLKFIFQFILTLPKIGDVAFIIREIPIAFLHLVMLGFLSCSIIYWLSVKNFLKTNTIFFKYGVYIFLTGLLLSEILLFSTAFVYWFRLYLFPNLNDLLFAGSVILTVGIILISVNQLSNNRSVKSADR
jgi:hypothetical protein